MNSVVQSNKNIFLRYIKENFDTISQRQMAKQLKIGKTTINRWSKEIGLKRLKHTVNEKFFSTFNENASYILGFIFADGNIAWNTDKGYYALTITSSAKDKEHLEKIRTIISSTKPLIYSQKTNSYRLIVNNKKMCKRLMILGVIPKKSLIVRFPKLPSQQLKHFIRGVIDGDGNVRFVQRKKSPYFEITIASGSKSFCDGLVKSIKKHAAIDAQPRKIGKNTYIVQYSCTRGTMLARYIYSGASIFLERKQAQYKNWLEVEKNEKSGYHIGKRD